MSQQPSLQEGAPSALKIVIRADASSAIGTGHVLRNLGLAEELRARNHAVQFVCKNAAGHLIEIIRCRGYHCDVLPANISMSEDAKLTVEALGSVGGPVDWLIVDHYGLDARWETFVKPFVRRLFAFDDLADRPHDADVLLDAAHDESAIGAYRRLVPRYTTLLLGAAYAPLRREFFSRPQTLRQMQPVRRILVTFGGNDPLNMTSLALRALSYPTFSSVAIDVTLGLSNPRLQEVKCQAEAIENVTVHVQHPNPSVLMERADLCLGAGGTTTWERCYVGLPSLIIVLADNQQEFAEMCDRRGVARYIGRGEMLTVDGLRHAIDCAMRDGDWRITSSKAGQALVDGHGIARLIQVLEAPERRQSGN